MMPEDEMVFLRATNEVQFRVQRIADLEHKRGSVVAGTETNPLVVSDVGTLPKHRVEFMQAGETLKRLAQKYPHDDRPKSAYQRWELDLRDLPV